MNTTEFEAERNRVKTAITRAQDAAPGTATLISRTLREIHMGMPFEDVSGIVGRKGRTPGVLADEVEKASKLGMKFFMACAQACRAPDGITANLIRQAAADFACR